MKQPPTATAKFVILLSQIGIMIVVGIFGLLFVAETWRDAETSELTVGQWVIAVIIAVTLLAIELSILRSLIELLKQPVASTDSTNESRVSGKKPSGISGVDASATDCPNGHGPLQEWKGKPRCSQCGWPDT